MDDLRRVDACARFLHPHNNAISEDISGVPGPGRHQDDGSHDAQIFPSFHYQAEGKSRWDQSDEIGLRQQSE